MMLDQRGRDAAEELRRYATERAAESDFTRIRRINRWHRIASAVAVAILAVGAVIATAWLRGDAERPVVTPSPATSSTTAPSTEAPPDESLAPAGSGPELSWTPASSAPVDPASVTWFQDAFYVLSYPRTLYRSDDGSVWEEVPSFGAALPEGTAMVHSGVATDANRIVVLLEVPWPGSVDPGFCPTASGVLTVAASSDGSSWSVAEVAADIAQGPSEAICVSFFPGAISVGPAGVLVSAHSEVETNYERLIADALGPEVAENLESLQRVTRTDFSGFIFSTFDGQRYELSFSELGYTDEDLAMSFGGAFAWWSADGVAWDEVSREDAPMRSRIDSMTAVDDGFVVQGANGLWKTTDGSAWVEVDRTSREAGLMDWAGTPVLFHWRLGNLRLMDDDTALPVSEGFIDFDVYEIGLGEAGILASLILWNDWEEGVEDAPEGVLVFSPDGVEWRRWTPENLDFRPLLLDIAVGADRIVAITPGGPEYAVWVGVPED